jgi:hypothetical protein
MMSPVYFEPRPPHRKVLTERERERRARQAQIERVKRWCAVFLVGAGAAVFAWGAWLEWSRMTVLVTELAFDPPGWPVAAVGLSLISVGASLPFVRPLFVGVLGVFVPVLAGVLYFWALIFGFLLVLRG